MSTATIFNVSLSHHNSEIKCQTALALPESRNISIAGVTTIMHESCFKCFRISVATISPSNLSISTAPVSLTWLAPPNEPTDCLQLHYQYH